MAPPPTHDSAVSPCFQGCPAFLYRHFSPKSPSHLLDLSLHSQQQPLPWDCSTISKLLLPAAAPSRGPVSLSRDVWLWQGLSVLIPFRLPQINCFTLSLKCFFSDSDNCPDVGIRPLLQFPHPLRAGPVLLTLKFFPLVPSPYRVLCGSIYSFHWSVTPVHSQLVVCMHFCD